MRLMAEHDENKDGEREELMIISEVLCYYSSVLPRVDQSQMIARQAESGTTLRVAMPE